MSYQVFHGILMAAHRVTRITPDQILSKNRAAKVVRVRQAVAHALRARTEWSLPHIGRILGGRDHSTALYGVRTIEGMLGDPDVARLVNALRNAPEIQMAKYDAWLCGLRGEPKKVEKRCYLKPVAKAEPAPVKPAREQLKWFASVDEDGQCYGERYMQFDLRRGSEKLRRAIVLARAA